MEKDRYNHNHKIVEYVFERLKSILDEFNIDISVMYIRSIRTAYIYYVTLKLLNFMQHLDNFLKLYTENKSFDILFEWNWLKKTNEYSSPIQLIVFKDELDGTPDEVYEEIGEEEEEKIQSYAKAYCASKGIANVIPDFSSNYKLMPKFLNSIASDALHRMNTFFCSYAEFIEDENNRINLLNDFYCEYYNANYKRILTEFRAFKNENLGDDTIFNKKHNELHRAFKKLKLYGLYNDCYDENANDYDNRLFAVKLLDLIIEREPDGYPDCDQYNDFDYTREDIHCFFEYYIKLNVLDKYLNKADRDLKQFVKVQTICETAPLILPDSINLNIRNDQNMSRKFADAVKQISPKVGAKGSRMKWSHVKKVWEDYGIIPVMGDTDFGRLVHAVDEGVDEEKCRQSVKNNAIGTRAEKGKPYWEWDELSNDRSICEEIEEKFREITSFLKDLKTNKGNRQ